MQILLFGGDVSIAETSFVTVSFMLALIAMIIAIAAALLWKKFGNIGDIMSSNRNKFHSVLSGWLAGRGISSGTSPSLVITEWIESQSNTNYKVRSSRKMVVADKFIGLLERDFNVKAAKNLCELGRPVCTLIYELTPKEGVPNKFFVAFNTQEWKAKDPLDRPTLESKTVEDLTEFELGNGTIVLGSGIEIVSSASLPEDDEDFRAIVNFIELSACESVYYDDVDKSLNTQVFRLNMQRGELNLTPLWKKTRNLSPETLNATFMPFTVNYMGEQHKIKPAAFAKLAAEQVLYKGENVQLYGTFGTGKSTIMEMVQYYLGQMDNVMCIIVSPDQIKELQAHSGTLLSRLSPDPNDGNPTRIVFCIDDAEKALSSKDGIHTEDNTLLLSILDGDWKQQLGCSTIMTFNADRKMLNQGIFRAGRAGLSAEVYPLDGETANTAVAALRRIFTNKTFDANRFKELLTSKNMLPNGTVYSEAGTITIADIANECFKNREYTAAIKAAIREYSAPVEEVPAPTESAPVKIATPARKTLGAPPPTPRRS